MHNRHTRCRQRQPLGMVSPGPGRDRRTARRADTCGTAQAGRRPDAEIAAQIPVPSDNEPRGERGIQTEKSGGGSGGGSGGRGLGRSEQTRGLETGTGSGLCRKELKDGQRRGRSGHWRGRGTQSDGEGHGTAPRGVLEHGGD